MLLFSKIYITFLLLESFDTKSRRTFIIKIYFNKIFVEYKRVIIFIFYNFTYCYSDCFVQKDFIPYMYENMLYF